MNLIDQSLADAEKAVQEARLFVQQAPAMNAYLKAIRTKYLQDASNGACLGAAEKSIELLHKADAIAAIYEQLFGVDQ
jgi:hypothetical protein